MNHIQNFFNLENVQNVIYLDRRLFNFALSSLEWIKDLTHAIFTL